jgi:non-ribosomal peptide synthetase component E (peptide arylation enzyme)
MTDEQRAELHRLAEERGRARDARHNFGYINVAGRTREELDQINRRGAELDAEVVETEARYRAFLARLAAEAAT